LGLGQIFGLKPVFFRGAFSHCSIFSKACLHFLNQHKILDFSTPNMTYFQKKRKKSLFEGPFFQCSDTKTSLWETAEGKWTRGLKYGLQAHPS
jgi:hypothetical protein